MFMALLSDAARDDLHRVGTSVYHRRGQDLARAGTALDAVHVIDSGWVKLWAPRDGAEQILDLMGPGALLGDVEFTGDRPHLCHVTALTDVRATAVSRDAFAALAEDHPEIYRALARSITARFRDEYALLTAHQARQRLGVLLGRLADRYGRTTPDGLVHVAVPLTRTLLARWARLTTAASGRIVTRSFGSDVQFRAEGLLLRRESLTTPEEDL
ncbi:Crp/Fnr family transcriptional regulator [Actinocorallia sp. API 0066]|uniref:Crp/Fnr family transcriptional regulator n=1 Tax=Actinocorallia sp. API 0066 TaxID=2896846 RepID=UPI001E562836|nr:Crp/Fnr family transcriptional regulator [Actinocorallia sp. API 0066]MCD0448820.1 Crp/Fnr family transcriptional regulator [Actinocorallia sp. API 0066]